MTEQTKDILNQKFTPSIEDKDNYQNIVMDMTDTVQMTDISVLMPLETDLFLDAQFKDEKMPDPARAKLCQFFNFHQLKFLLD